MPSRLFGSSSTIFATALFAVACVLLTNGAAVAADVPSPPLHEQQRHKLLKTEKRMKGASPKADTATVAPVLPPLNVNPNTFTVSGFDSGAIFANQMQIAHSSVVKGAGLVSGVPFLCSEGTLIGASACMLNPLAIMNSALIAQTLVFQALNQIDNIANLANQYTLVFGSPSDSVVGHLATERMVQMLSSLGATTIDTLYNYSSAGHAWITDTSMGNNPCNYNGSPYINDCQLAFGNVFLKKALGFLGVPTTALPSASMSEGSSSASVTSLPNMITFNQAVFGADVTLNSMDTAGLAFIPPQCYAENTNGRGGVDTVGNNSTNPTLCHIHFHFHGCQQSRTDMGTGYASRTGLNSQWAIDNDIIIVYPQAAPNALKSNPMGCWDWFNYNNENYYTNWGEFGTKNGVQVRIVKHLLNSMLAGE